MDEKHTQTMQQTQHNKKRANPTPDKANVIIMFAVEVAYTNE